MARTTEWESIAASAGPDELRERILTGYQAGKPFTPYVPTVALPSPLEWVLDFGCGVGRSFPYLRTIATHVAGFDLEPMIARCRLLATEPVDLLSADWSELSTRTFDLVFADLVLQHVEPDACRAYLTDFASMAPVTYLLTRLQSDFGENVLKLVADTGLFHAEVCAEVEHDPASHQLRQTGLHPFAAVSHADDNRHYEVVLRSWTLRT
jgi:SAM-dependent methyltransferase